MLPNPIVLRLCQNLPAHQLPPIPVRPPGNNPFCITTPDPRQTREVIRTRRIQIQRFPPALIPPLFRSLSRRLDVPPSFLQFRLDLLHRLRRLFPNLRLPLRRTLVIRATHSRGRHHRKKRQPPPSPSHHHSSPIICRARTCPPALSLYFGCSPPSIRGIQAFGPSHLTTSRRAVRIFYLTIQPIYATVSHDRRWRFFLCADASVPPRRLRLLGPKSVL